MIPRVFHLMAAVLLLLVSLGMLSRADATSAPTPPLRDQRLEPRTGTYLGVNYDWTEDSARRTVEELGFAPASFGYSVVFPFRGTALADMTSFMRQIARQGGIVVLTVQPGISLETFGARHADALAAALARFNQELDVPVLLRFAPDMNGTWYAWGQKPAAYVRVFREVARAVHASAPNTAMLWTPAPGQGYPFPLGRYRAIPGTENFALLDTNDDGRLTAADDPYRPYYPGDEAVDWVGLNLYHWGNDYPFGENEVPTGGKFAALLGPFYQEFSTGANPDKPVFVETGALYNPGAGGASELAIKRAWWRQVLGAPTLDRFPNLHMVTWLDWVRAESEAGGATISWGLSTTPEVARAFRADLDRSRVILGPVTRPDAVAPSSLLPTGIVAGVLFGALAFGSRPWLRAATVRRAPVRPSAVAASGAGVGAGGARTGPDRGTRDLRIDALRGLAIVFVVVDHIDIPSLYHLVSHERIGAISGAELFVVLAGVVLGMIYRGRATEENFVGNTSRLWTRARALYVVALLVVLGSFLLSLGPWADVQVLTTWTDKATGTVYNLYGGAENPARFVANVVLLNYGPYEFNVVGLYVILLLLTPLMLMLLQRGQVRLLLGISWALYLVYTLAPVRLLPTQFEYSFPLLAWQVLYVNGLVLGFYRQSVLDWFARTRAGRMTFVLSVVLFVGFLFFTNNNPWEEFAADQRLAVIPAATFYALYGDLFERAGLGILRLLNVAVFLVVAYALLTRFWAPFDRVLGWFLVPLGQATLYVFILHVVYVYVVMNIPVFQRGSVLANTLGHTAVLALLWLMVKREVLFRWIPR